MITYYDQKSKPEQYILLFTLFTKNKDLKYNEFIKKINESLNTNYDLNDLKEIIREIRKSHSVSKASTMVDVLNYVLSNNSNKELKEKLSNIENDFFYIKKGKLCNSKLNNNNKEKDKEKYIEELNKQMMKVITKEETQQKSSLTSNIKANLKYIDIEKYVDYLKEKYNLVSTSKEELNQFLQVINYFIFNIEDKIYKLNFLDPYKDEDKVRNIHVSNEDAISNYYKDNIHRFYAWKVQSLESLLDKYNDVKDIIETIIKNNNISDFKTIKYSYLESLKEDEQFVYDYYKDLYEIKKVYDRHIKAIYSINDKKRNEIDELFTKKLILGNNN